MKAHLNLFALVALAIVLVDCAHVAKFEKGDFLSFLKREIESMGGNTASFKITQPSLGKWKCVRDNMGALITVSDPSFDDIMKVLRSSYGEPKIIAQANQRRGAWYLFPVKPAHVAIGVAALEKETEITCTRPLRFSAESESPRR